MSSVYKSKLPTPVPNNFTAIEPYFWCSRFFEKFDFKFDVTVFDVKINSIFLFSIFPYLMLTAPSKNYGRILQWYFKFNLTKLPKCKENMTQLYNNIFILWRYLILYLLLQITNKPNLTWPYLTNLVCSNPAWATLTSPWLNKDLHYLHLMRDKFFKKLPKLGKINFGTAKVQHLLLDLWPKFCFDIFQLRSRQRMSHIQMQESRAERRICGGRTRNQTRCQFHQHSRSSFYARRSQKRKKDCQVKQLYCAIGDLRA